jgi:CTP synthase
VKTLQEYGLQPDILVCRTEHKLSKEIKNKIALFCNVEPEAVIEAIDADTIYEVPVLMEKEKLDIVTLVKLQLPVSQNIQLDEWKKFLKRLREPKFEVHIGLVGKYVELKDSYKSISEALIHGGVANNCRVNVRWIHSESISQENVTEKLAGLSGIIVAPGFGKRGIEGKIVAIRWARENKIPFLGICLGMQCAVIEFARNVMGMKDAHSTEINPNTPHPVIDLMETQKSIIKKGGTMRLGAYPCKLKEGTKVFSIYNQNSPEMKELISERHRHRYEFNNKYLDEFEKAGMLASGINPEGGLVEIVELKEHPFFIGVQFHPEYKSTVANPHPLFVGFVDAVKKYESEKRKEYEKEKV